MTTVDGNVATKAVMDNDVDGIAATATAQATHGSPSTATGNAATDANALNDEGKNTLTNQANAENRSP